MPLPPRVFCDTSFFQACLDPSDTHHPQAYPLVTDAMMARVALWTTWDVVSETATLLRYRVSHASALAFVDTLYPRLRLVSTGAKCAPRRWTSSAGTVANGVSPSATRSRSWL
jgi:hypothetical protein